LKELVKFYWLSVKASHSPPLSFSFSFSLSLSLSNIKAIVKSSVAQTRLAGPDGPIDRHRHRQHRHRHRDRRGITVKTWRDRACRISLRTCASISMWHVSIALRTVAFCRRSWISSSTSSSWVLPRSSPAETRTKPDAPVCVICLPPASALWELALLCRGMQLSVSHTTRTTPRVCCYIDAVGNGAGDPAWIPPVEEARGSREQLCRFLGFQRECEFNKQGDDKLGDNISFVSSTCNHTRNQL